MPFVYRKNTLALIGTPRVGTGECAAIAQSLVAGLGDIHACHWRRGAKVQGNMSLLPGTVIATFDSNGRYIGTAKHNHSGGVAHTALYLGQTAVGVEIVHQFNSHPNIQGALVRFDGKKTAGLHAGVSASGGCPEDDARNYYAVEL